MHALRFCPLPALDLQATKPFLSTVTSTSGGCDLFQQDATPCSQSYVAAIATGSLRSAEHFDAVQRLLLAITKDVERHARQTSVTSMNTSLGNNVPGLGTESCAPDRA